MRKPTPNSSGWNASTLFDIARAFISDTPSLALRQDLIGMIRSRNVKGICETVLPDPASHSLEYISLRQLQSFFKKNDAFANDDICSQNAIKSFMDAEALCKLTNQRLDDYCFKRVHYEPDFELLIERTKSYFRSYLGCEKAFLDKLPELVRITGGATEDRPRKRSLPFLKISRKVRTTTGSVPLVRSFISFAGYKKELRVTTTDTNRVVFVPKNYKTHRTIACEPTGTLPFQLAVDHWIKRNLVKDGCDLSDQTKNQDMARIGSLTGAYATIDLSSASDSLSLNTIALLCTDGWFNLLMRLRCRFYKGDVGEGSYAKYASMGNGITFALESALFLAIVRASGSMAGSVYGDDIIIEPIYLPRLYLLLEFFGFKINTEKSFVSGPFRESCGTDWLEGRLVTPFYIRSIPSNSSECCHVINGLVRISKPHGAVWKLLRELSRGLPLVPESLDSMTGIHIPYSDACRRRLVRSESKKYGKYVPVAWQLVPTFPKLKDYGIRSLIVWLLFEKKVVNRPYQRFFNDYIIDSRATEWPTGSVRYKRKLAPVRLCPCSSPILNLWEQYLS